MRRMMLVLALGLLPFVAHAAEKKKQGAPIEMDMSLKMSDDQKEIDRSEQVFGEYMTACMAGFDDADALRKRLSAEGYTEMAADALADRLNGKPGLGWVKGDLAAADRIEVIVQHAPRRACSTYAFNGNAGNYDLMGQMMFSALGTAPELSIMPYELPKTDLKETVRQRGYVMKPLEDGKEVEGAPANILIMIVDRDPQAAFRVRYVRINP